MAGLKLIGELGLDGSGFASGLKKAEGLAASAGHGIRDALIGMVGIGTISLAITKTVESAQQLAVAAERLGVGTTNLQVLRKAAVDAGVEFEKFEKTLEHVDVARQKALTPGKEGQDARRAFAQFGITPEMLRSMTASDMFTGPMRQKALGTNEETLGPLLSQLTEMKGVAAVIPLLKTDFGELEDKMKKYGAIMDAETIVKLRHLGDEFGLIGQVITGVLGPALVAFGDWLLKLVATEGSFLNRVLEGVDYRGREAMGMAKLPDVDGHSAAERHGAGVTALDMAQRTDLRKTSPEQFRSQWRDYYTKGLGADKNPGYASIFNQSKGNTWAEFQKEIQGMIQPVADVRNDAAKGATADMKGLADSIAEFQARMKAEADRLEHPEAPGNFNGKIVPPSRKSLEIPSDSLTRVGNFLGGSQSSIMRLAQRRTDLLAQIARNTAHAGAGTGSRGPGSAMGGMNSVFVPAF